MSEKKTALIVTDGDRAVRNIAKAIAASLKDWRVQLLNGGEFAGTHILPAELCFFGCAAVNPPSFQYLDTLLKHINLSGRPCGIFSPSKEAAGYLEELVRDSELDLFPQTLAGEKDAENWTGNVINRIKKR